MRRKGGEDCQNKRIQLPPELRVVLDSRYLPGLNDRRVRERDATAFRDDEPLHEPEQDAQTTVALRKQQIPSLFQGVHAHEEISLNQLEERRPLKRNNLS